MTENQIYWQRYETASTISQLNPDIAGVRVDAVPVYHGMKDNEHAVYAVLSPEHKYMLRLRCPNADCSSGFIEISDEISDAVKSGRVVEGEKRCRGHLKKYAHNKSSAFDCEAYVKYRIEPEPVAQNTK